MRILYSGRLDAIAGGAALTAYNNMRGLNDLGVDTHMLIYEKKNDERLVGDDVPIHYTKRPIDPAFNFSPTYKKSVRECGEFDIYHAQGIWLYNTYAIVDVARGKGKPYIITPHGMLYPQDIMKSKPFFKKLSLKLRLLDDLNYAACVHTTCEEERMHCRRLGVTSPIAVIPNPVEIKEYPQQTQDGVFRLGYLGRISRRKNVEGLIYAWSELGEQVKDAELIIIGDGDKEYMKFLQSECARLQLQNVRFTGFVTGQEKDEVLSSLSVLAMPSEFENLGNVILEGLVRGIPCIATKGAPWKDLTDNRCGWWVEYNQEAITAAVKEALETPVAELHAMGERGKALIRQKYSIEAVASQMKALYEWILGKADKPSFVDLPPAINRERSDRMPIMDLSKGIFMFFVILCHCGYVPRWLDSFYGPFFLSGFFFISGFFFLKPDGDRFNYKQKLMNICTTILAAYLVYWCLSFSVDHLLQRDWFFIDDLFVDILAGRKLWFISCLIVSELLAVAYFAALGTKAKAVYAFAAVNLAAYLLLPIGDYPWYFNISFLANFYIALGIIARRYGDGFMNLIRSNRYGWMLCGAFLVMYLVDIVFIHQKMSFNYSFTHLWYFIPESVLSFLAIIFLCSKVRKLRLLQFMGENSLQYYFYQHQVLVLVTMRLGTVLGIGCPNALYSFASAGIVSVVLIPVILFVNRYIPVMAGKWRVRLIK